MSFLELHNVINQDHHGSRKDHSTTTALAAINNSINIHYQNGNLISIIQTDLSAAFDMVDHSILLEKLRHYGIDGNENLLIKSILSNRTQYVEIDGFISDTTTSINCSVLQGSKLSSILYVLYCNEIPLLHKLVGSQIMAPLIGNTLPFNISNISHHITQYVDDSTNVIASKDPKDLQLYIKTYFKVLEEYYNLNKLSINADKSKLLIITKPNLRNITSQIKLQANKYTIEQSQKIKVLGIFITSGFNNIATVNSIISKVNFCLTVLNEIFKYSNIRTKLMLTNSIIVSVIQYAVPILISGSNKLISKLQVLLMRCSHPILGFTSYKLST